MTSNDVYQTRSSSGFFVLYLSTQRYDDQTLISVSVQR
jgi:hypothetical protein